MDINKIKKVRNTLRLQFGGGISNQTMSLNDINQFRQNSLNLNYISNEIDKLQPIYHPTKRPTGLQILNRSIEKNNNSNILPLSNSINFENNEIPEKIEQFTPKLSKRISYKHESDEIEKLSEADDEESKKQLELANKSAEQAISGVGTMATNIGQIFNANQQSTDSNLTKNIDAGYDAISDGLTKLGPIGKIAGTGMKVLETLGDIGQEYLGTGTDQQSTLDKWMDSPLFSWNVGLLNGAAGKNTDSFAIDQNTAAKIGSSYGGSISELNDAAEKADKKYGLLSWKSRKKANDAIAKAKTTQNAMSNIADTASDQRLAVQSMGEQAGLAYSMMTNGGFDQKYTYAAKKGGLLEWHPVIKLNQELPEYKEGGELLEWTPGFQKGGKLNFDEWFNSIPKEYRDLNYDYQKAYDVFEWEDLYKHSKNPEKNHLKSVSTIPDENGNYPFLKLGKIENNPELQGEFDWYNSKEGKEYKSKFDIKYINDRYYYVPKQFKNGGSINNFDIPEIEETTQKNVIPEGALHKNKHHMEHAEGLTKKGIPVIDNDGEQQAEIEHSEIIFTLEITKKLEEYYNIFYSDESSNKEKEQAAIDVGKLLVYQILENTDDRTNLIESCKDGGILKFKKSTDDLIEEALEWIPQIIVIEEEIKEEPKDKKKSEKEEMKETIKEVLIELLVK